MLDDELRYTVPINEGNQIKVGSCPVPSLEVQDDVLSASISNDTNSGNSNKSTAKEPVKKSKFGPQLQFDSHDFNFQKELDQLPFLVNIREVELSKAQQKWFLELIYDHQHVFSLCTRASVSVPTSNTLLPQLWISQCTCHIRAL